MMNTTPRSTLSLALALACFVMLGSSSAAGNSLRVRAASDKAEYVLGEPVKVVTSIRNDAGVTVRVPLIASFGQTYMKFTYFEVTSPDGTVQRRKSVSVLQYGVWNPNYRGAPLAPGDSLQIYYYPSLSNRRAEADGHIGERLPDPHTFPVPGTYILRVVFAPWAEFEQLYQGVWHSNPVVIRFRQPDPIEQEILDVVSHCAPRGESGIDLAMRDVERLAAVIAKHPDHRLTNHARYALARSYYREALLGRVGAAQDAVRELHGLMERTPDFRYEETRLLLGKSFIEAGDQQQGAEVLLGSMEKNPALWTNPDFVEAVTIVGVRDYSVTEQWTKRESEIGARPMSRRSFLTEFHEAARPK